MDKPMPQQVQLKTSVTVDKSAMQAGVHLKGLWLMDKSMLEQGQVEYFNAMLNPVTWSKGTKGEDCNGYTLRVLQPMI